MEAQLAEVIDRQQFAVQLVLNLPCIRRDGALQVLHRGVLVVIVVAVRVKHEQRTRRSEKATNVIHTEVQLLHHLHLGTRHTDALELLKTPQRHDVLLIDFVADLLGVFVRRVFVVHAETELSGLLILRDEALDATALGSRFEGLRLLRLDERKRLEGVLERGHPPEAVLEAVGVREVQHILARHVSLGNQSAIGQIDDVVRAEFQVVPAAVRQPERNGHVIFGVTLDVDEAVAFL